jgi:hypothetical protein
MEAAGSSGCVTMGVDKDEGPALGAGAVTGDGWRGVAQGRGGGDIVALALGLAEDFGGKLGYS